MTGDIFRADRLTAELRRTFMTSVDLCRQIDVAEKTVSRWRSGQSEPLYRHVRALAVLFDRQPQWFYEHDDEEVAA